MRYNLKFVESCKKTTIGLDGIIEALTYPPEPQPPNPKTIVTYQNGDVIEYLIEGELGSASISDKTNIVKVDIGTAVTSIGTNAFKGCSGLISIMIPDNVTIIGDWAFYRCSGLTSITIPNSVTIIGNWAFYRCSGLTSITIPNGVTSIGSSAFSDCSNLRYVIIENGVTNINGTNIFQNCTSLTSINIPNNMSTIPQSLLIGCSSISSIVIPSSITNIENYAFQDCVSLSSITCKAITAPTVKRSTFGYGADYYTGRNTYNTGDNVLKVPHDATGYTSSYWNSMLLDSSKCGFHIIYE